MQISSRPAQRIVVIGTSCAGKSTFAQALGAKLGLPVVELDALHWGPHWTAASPQAFRASVESATAGDAWIAEGNYGAVRELLWSRAGTIIWLNYGFPLVLWRAVRRTVSRSLRGTELWNGNRESLRRSFLARDSILVWVVQTFHRRQREFNRLRASGAFANLDWVELRTPAQAQALLDSTTLANDNA